MSPAPEIIYLKVQNAELPVHRRKLCAESPIFTELFTRNQCPEINDIDVAVFKVLNHFIWKGDINQFSLDKYAIDLIYAADKVCCSSKKFYSLKCLT